MEFVVLRSYTDVEVAETFVKSGDAVWVEVDFEPGPDGPEPKVELLRLLLDHVQRHYPVEERRYVPHPSVPSRYLRSCLIQPTRRRGPGGVHKPRAPRPNPNASRASHDRPPE